MDRSPPPFFKQGPSANARLAFFALFAIVLLVVDARMNALTGLRQGIGAVLYPLQRTLLVPRDVVAMSTQYVSEVQRLRAENEEMRKIEVANAKSLLEAEQLGAENERLRALLGARNRAAVKSITAEVLYDTRDPFTRKLVVDRGAQHGVIAGQPVMDAKGVVGQITRSFPLSSEVTLVTDRNATVPVEFVRTGQRSLAYGAGPVVGLELRYLPSSADVKEGDLLVTSGLDSLYPPGLPVGRVRSIDRAGAQTFIRVSVQPAAGVEQSRLLLVLQVDESQLLKAPLPEVPIEARKRGGKG